VQVWHVFREKDGFAARAYLLALLALPGNTEQFWEYFVSTHADEGAHLVKGHPMTVCRHRLNPGMRVSIVAINQSTIYIENHILDTLWHG
jgi:hypothetical protein